MVDKNRIVMESKNKLNQLGPNLNLIEDLGKRIKGKQKEDRKAKRKAEKVARKRERKAALMEKNSRLEVALRKNKKYIRRWIEEELYFE